MTNFIHKSKKDTDYYVMPNELAQNRKLSFEARGMLAYIMSQSENWRVQPKDLQQQCGKNRVYRILNELIKAGYVNREPERDDKKRIINWHYHVSDELLPQNLEVGLQEQENRDVIKERTIEKKEKDNVQPPVGQAGACEATPPTNEPVQPLTPGNSLDGELPTVVHFKSVGLHYDRIAHNWNDDKYIYIGRANPRNGLAGSIWANPFKVTGDQTREEAISRYRDYIRNSSELLAKLPELLGKTLICWCKPEACHGDVLVELLGDLLQKKQQLTGDDLIDMSPLTPDEIAMGLEVADDMFAAMGYHRAETKDTIQLAGKIGEVRQGEPSSFVADEIEIDLDDSNDPFANKNESGDSVNIMGDICLKCGKISHSIVDANGISERVCECKSSWSSSPEAIARGKSIAEKLAQDNPSDNPNLSQLSQEQAWILHTLARVDVDCLKHKVLSGAVGKMMINMRYLKYLKVVGSKKNCYRLGTKGKNWLADNRYAPQTAIDDVEIVLKSTKRKAKRKYERKLESLSSDVIPIAEALANCRHGSTYNDVLNGRREGIKKIAEKMRDDGLTADDVETIQAYFEYRAKEQPDGANVWLKCNYDTYYKHAQDALDWKKKAPEKANDGIRLAHVVGDDDDY